MLVKAPSLNMIKLVITLCYSHVFNPLGDSSLDFLYYFAREANETHPGLRKMEGSPITGLSHCSLSHLCNAKLILYVHCCWDLYTSNDYVSFLPPHFFIGVPVFLVVTVTGMSPNEEASFSHVTLLGPNGKSLQKVLLNSTSSHWSEEELVGYMDSVPRMPFCMRLSGKDRRGNLLERVSTEMIQPTHVQIQV